MLSINWQQLKVYKTLLSPSTAVEHRVLPSVCASVANIWKPKSNKFYGKNDFVHLAPGYLPFLFDISSSSASTASCCLSFIQFYCVITLNWLKIGCKRFKALSLNCKVFRKWKDLAEFCSFTCCCLRESNFHQFHKIGLLLEIKAHFSLQKSKWYTRRNCVSTNPFPSLSHLPHPFPFATCVFWFPCCLLALSGL